MEKTLGDNPDNQIPVKVEGNDKLYTEEWLKEKIIEIPNRGGWKILGFIQPQHEGEGVRVITKSLTVKNQREVIKMSELIANLEEENYFIKWKIIK